MDIAEKALFVYIVFSLSHNVNLHEVLLLLKVMVLRHQRQIGSIKRRNKIFADLSATAVRSNIFNSSLKSAPLRVVIPLPNLQLNEIEL